MYAYVYREIYLANKYLPRLSLIFPFFKIAHRALTFTFTFALIPSKKNKRANLLWALRHSGTQLLPQQPLQRLTVLGKLLDPLVQLVERHLVLQQRPSELGLVVDEGDFRDRVGAGGWKEVKKRIKLGLRWE
jgi:hypothetical protein